MLTSSLELPSPSLRNSHSDYELNKAGATPNSAKRNDENRAVIDYYNILVPHLPAHSQSRGQNSIRLRNKFDNTHSNSSRDVVSPEKGSGGIQPEDWSENAVAGQPTVEDFQKELDDVEDAAKPSNGQIPTAATADVLSRVPVPMPSAGIYDTLAPLTDGSDAPGSPSPQPLYDSLLPKRKAKSTSSSPEPCTPDHLNKTYQYNRKVQLLQHGHKYEYIDVELSQNENNDTLHHRSSSPARKEHPSSWMASPSPRQDEERSSLLLRTTLPSILSRRKKQLPLQDSPMEDERHFPGTESERGTSESGSATQKSKPQLSQLPKESSVDSSCESPKSPRKPHPLPRKGVHSQQVSSDLVSSIDSYIGKQENLLPSGHSNIVDGNLYPTKGDGHQVTAGSSSQQVATPKIKSIQVELAMEQRDGNDVDPPVLPPRKKLSNNAPSDASSQPFQSPVPAIPPRPSADIKDVNEVASPSSTSTPSRLSEPGIKLPLPQKEIKFHPPGPPKPKVLCPPPDSSSQQKYVAISFAEVPAGDSSEYHEVLVHPSASTQSSVPQGHNNDSSEDRVEYTRVDFLMTYGLGKTIEQVEDRRRGFPDSRHT